MSDKLKLVVLDSNEDTRKAIKSFVQVNFPAIDYAGEADSTKSAYSIINTVTPQIVLMEVQLNGESSSEFLSKLLNENKLNFELIFLTSPDSDSMSNAIEFTALDSISKPLDNNDAKSKLQNALTRASLIIDKRLFKEQIRLFVDLFSKNTANNNNNKRIALHLLRGFIQFVNINDIVLLKTDDNITRISLNDGRVLSSVNNLAFYSKLLTLEMGFIRISQSTMVNNQYIDKFNPSEKIIILTNGDSIDCSRRGAKLFRDYLDNNQNQNDMQQEGGFQALMDKFTSIFRS
ncbi:MAG: LytTR family transcriptional regulator DNA-binding domain-containing protein [Saprospiraceae bacterium]